MKNYANLIIKLYRKQWSRLLFIAFVALLPSAMLQLVQPENLSISPIAFIILALLNIVFIFGGIIMFALLAKNPTSNLMDLLRQTLKKIAPVMLTALLGFLFLIPLFLLLIIPGTIFSIRWILAPYAAILTPEYALGAIKTSAKITKGRWWRTAGIIGVFGLLIGAVQLLLFMGIFFFSLPEMSLESIIIAIESGFQNQLIYIIPTTIFSIIIMPIQPLLLSYMFLDYEKQYQAKEQTGQNL